MVCVGHNKTLDMQVRAVTGAVAWAVARLPSSAALAPLGFDITAATGLKISPGRKSRYKQD